MAKTAKAYMDWSGGLNTDRSPDHMADNELARADNVVLDLRGAFSTRKGCQARNLVSYDSAVTQVFEWSRDDGSTVLLVVVDGVLNTVGTNGVLTEVQELAEGCTEVAWAAFRNELYFVDGDELYVYDGETCEAVTPNADVSNDLTPIKRCRFLLWHPRTYRFYAAGDTEDASALYYSEPNDPTYWKATSKLYPTQADGPVTALALFAHVLMVFFSDSVWTWKGIDPDTDATWTRLPVPYGTQSPHTIALTPNSLTWLAKGALVAVSPAILDYNITLMPGSELVMDLSADKVTSLVQGIYHPETACGVYDPTRGRYMLAYCDDLNGTTNNKVLVLHWNARAFSRFTGWRVHSWCFQRSTRSLLFGTDNYLLETEQGYNDVDLETGEATPILVEVKTKLFNLGHPFTVKRLSKIYLSGQVGGGQPPVLHVEARSTGRKGKTLRWPLVAFNEGMVWGDVWGTKWPYEDAVTAELRAKCRGERFQVTLRVDGPAQSLNFYGMAFEYTAKKKPEGVKYRGETV